MTLSDVIGIFQSYAANEGLIFHFEAREQMPNLSNEEDISTDALMQVVVSTLSPSFDTTSVTLDFYFLKQLDRDRTNYLSVMSDTTLLAAEFQQWMEVAIGSLQGINIAVNGSAIPVNNFDLDYTAGVTLNVGIVFANDGQCVIPPPPVCNPTDVSVNDVEAGSFVSGSAINVHLFDSNGDVTPIDVTVDDLQIDVELPLVVCEDVDLFVGEANVGSFPSGSDVFVKVIQDGLEVIPQNVTVVDDDVSIILEDTVPCADATVENSDATYTDTVASDGTLVLPDTHVHLKKENDGTIANLQFPSCVNGEYTVQNNDISVNGTPEFEIHATDALDIRLRDESNNVVNPVSVTHSGDHATIVLADCVAPANYIVDDYLPLAAYSLRKVSSSATVAIRVRRSRDNAEQDIGFINDDLDVVSLFLFVGQNSGYVTTLYDQSENGKHQRQTNASSQPIIVNAGVLSTLLGRASINITSTRFLNGSGSVSEQLSFSAKRRIDSFCVFKQSAAPFVLYNHRIDTSFFNIVGQSGSASSPFTGSVTVDGHYKNGNSVTIATSGNAYTQLATNAPLLFSQINYKSSTQAITSLSFGSYPNFEIQGNLTEWIVFNTNQSANRVSIESNINAYYGIY